MTSRKRSARPARAGAGRTILTLNAGSSSLKFALFRTAGSGAEEVARGIVDGLHGRPRLSARRPSGEGLAGGPGEADGQPGHGGALIQVIEWLGRHFAGTAIDAVGHRVVHGGLAFAEPVAIDEARLAALEALRPLAPLHQPHNLAAVRAASQAFPEALQVACFDTAFHRSHPWVNDTFALPRALYEEGVRRYGFHGLSYEFVTQEIARSHPHHAAGRLVVAHLGNGASMCAIQGGKSIASTMGFSALDGLPMGTRCGQLDPGVLLYLMRERGLSAEAIEDLLYRRSGLLGLSGLSHDMRELEAAGTPEAQAAIDYFVFRVKRELGGMTAVLAGLDALAFCGGIGENAWRVRERICHGFEWLGLELDESRNRAGAGMISSDRSRVRVLVVPTNEEAMIARHTARLLAAR